MSGDRKRFGRADVVVGDWAWGVGAWWPHPVIRVNRDSITVGIHRDAGCWLTTHILPWDDIRGVIPAEVDHHADHAAALDAAAARVRRGYLFDHQRDALAVLLQIVGTAAALPAPVTAVLRHVITALTATTPAQPPTGRSQPPDVPS